MSATARLWGYKPDGSARLFLISAGESLPVGWSPDINIIEDPAKRTGDAVSAAAGQSVHFPVVASEEAAKAVKEESKAAERIAASVVRYDEDNKLIPMKKNRIGR